MPGLSSLVPGIHAVASHDGFKGPTRFSAPDGAIAWTLRAPPDVDGRHKAGRDGTLSFSKRISSSAPTHFRADHGLRLAIPTSGWTQRYVPSNASESDLNAAGARVTAVENVANQA